MFFRVKFASGKKYLQLVTTEREGAKTKQRLLASLGRLDDLVQDGTVDGLIRSLEKIRDRWRAEKQ